MPNDPRILQSTPADIFPGGETPQLPAIIIGMPVGNAQAGLPLIVDSSSRLMQSSTLGTGTVSSVALAAPAEITVAGSPITGAGTFTLTWTNQTQNKVFASPNGSTGTPAFRALVNADLPTSGVAAATYTNATVTVNAQGIVTAASNGSAATSPYWRMREQAVAVGNVFPDSSYWNFGVNDATFATFNHSSDFGISPGGSFLYSCGNALSVFWARSCLVNSTGGNITVNFNILAFDDDLVVLNESPNAGTGTVTIPVAAFPGAQTVTGTGTSFTTEFAVGDYIHVGVNIWRITAIASNISMTIQNGGVGSTTQPFTICKKVYAANALNQAANALVSGPSTVILAGKTHTIHILGNNNSSAGQFLVQSDALQTAGITWADAGI